MKKLLVVWKSDDYRTIEQFIAPFTINSKKQEWFDDVEVLIWGASTDYLKKNVKPRSLVTKMIEQGIEVRACKYCSDTVKATDILLELGVNVMYTGVYLSDKMKDETYEVITL